MKQGSLQNNTAHIPGDESKLWLYPPQNGCYFVFMANATDSQLAA